MHQNVGYTGDARMVRTCLPVQDMQETQVQSLGWKDSGGGDDNPLQCSCLENSMDRGAWGATIHGVRYN